MGDRNMNFRQQKAQEMVQHVLLILTEIRKDKDLKRKELAEEMGVDPATALRVEKGHFEFTMKNFFEICLIYEVDPVSILSSAYQKAKKAN